MTQVTVAPAGTAPIGTDAARPPMADVWRAVAHRQLPALAVGADVLWWLVVAARWDGGRDPRAVSVGAVLTLVALVVTRADRAAPRAVLVWAGALSVAALGVAAFAPTGWAGAANAAEYVAAAWTVVAVVCWARQDRRATELVAVAVAAAAAVEVTEGWLAWWGGRDPAAPMLGTFYWYDAFAAFLIPGTALGVALWLRRRSAVAAIGLLAACLGSIGLVFSTSRAAVACAVVAVVAVIVGQVVSERRAGLLRVAGAVAAMAAAVIVISGPPFFGHRWNPFAGTVSRAAGQSLTQNGGYRVDFWREALKVFARHPLVGAGYHSLAAESVGRVPSSWPLSPLAHNGYLQVVTDGGLLLAVPFLAGVAAAVWIVLRRLVTACRAGDFGVVSFVLPLTAGAMLAHSAVDIDWSYPANLLLAAILVAVVAGHTTEPVAAEAIAVRRVSWGSAVVIAVMVVTLATAAWVARGGDTTLNLPIPGVTR